MEDAVQITDLAVLVVVISPALLLLQLVEYQDIQLVELMPEVSSYHMPNYIATYLIEKQVDVVPLATHAKLMDVALLLVFRTAKLVE